MITVVGSSLFARACVQWLPERQAGETATEEGAPMNRATAQLSRRTVWEPSFPDDIPSL